MCYATELESAKLTALRALTDILAATEDLAEKRRAATAILRIPDPDRATKRATPRATGCRGSERQPVPSTPDAPTNENPSSPSLPTQDSGPSTQDASPTFPSQQIEPKPHDSSPIVPLPPLKDRLPSYSTDLHPLSPTQSLLTTAGRAASLSVSLAPTGPPRVATGGTNAVSETRGKMLASSPAPKGADD